MNYGYNSNYEDKQILFKEGYGSCTSKHGVIAGLATELGIPLVKYIGVYKFTEEICKGTGKIVEKYQIPYIPMVHCFLVYNNYRFDLTEGNKNGKESNIESFIQTMQVDPYISRKKEYNLFRKILKQKIMPTDEMKGIKELDLLKARSEAIDLLHDKVDFGT
ncbi:MAG: hypothetical protein GF364_22185 [Candidatus Lokiarchaeota archaeon]|nr:hypothetical protein [Candidatus Lokiarchaeota archaeon]